MSEGREELGGRAFGGGRKDVKGGSVCEVLAVQTSRVCIPSTHVGNKAAVLAGEVETIGRIEPQSSLTS